MPTLPETSILKRAAAKCKSEKSVLRRAIKIDKKKETPQKKESEVVEQEGESSRSVEVKDGTAKKESEKTALYCDCGDKLHVRKGEHKGKNGIVVGKKREETRKESLDDEGFTTEKIKKNEEITLALSDGTRTVFCNQDDELERYYKEKHSSENEKKSYINNPGNYLTVGDKVEVESGEHEGKSGIVVNRVDESFENETLEDGEISRKEKRCIVFTIKQESGDTFDVKSTHCKEQDLDGDNDCAYDTCATKQSSEKEQRKKLARRILNGDIALDKIMEAFASVSKEAESDTVPAKVDKDETQEGVDKYPQGDEAGGEQDALRVEPVDTNIGTVDKAIDEVAS